MVHCLLNVYNSQHKNNTYKHAIDPFRNPTETCNENTLKKARSEVSKIA